MKKSKIENRKSKIFRSGFTLTELLIAVAIFVVLIAMAAPVFRTLTGSRSIASGTNVLSATLNRVRMEAIGFQQHRGVLFYLDQNTGRVGMVTVAESNAIPADAEMNGYGMGFDYTPEVWFDVVAGTESMLLPPGVGAEGHMSLGSTNRYIGFNRSYNLTSDYQINSLNRSGFIIAFTPDGRLFLGTPGTIWWNSVTNKESNAANFLFGSGLTYAQVGSRQGSSQFYPLMAISLFETDAFLSQFVSGSNDAWWDDPMYNAIESNKEVWLDNNATPFLINRYNGTLIRGE